MSMTNALIAASRFHALAAAAAANGGFWVSAAGGTANVVAGEISRATGVTFEDAHRALDATAYHVWGDSPIGGWYCAMADAQPWGMCHIPEEDEARWDAAFIARAACRPVALHGCGQGGL